MADRADSSQSTGNRVHVPALMQERLDVPRSQARKLIAQGKVSINGVRVENMDLTLDGPHAASLKVTGWSEWRETAEWDWVWLGNGDVLHAVASLTNDADEDWFGEGETECGRAGNLQIPGLFSRMSAKRCDRCCARTGMPKGKQSPKNVDECRPLVEQRIAALRSAAL